MTMVYLANVPHIETPFGIECYTQYAHVSIDYPIHEQPDYYVIVHWGSSRSRGFADFASALDYASRCLKQSEPT